MKYFYATLLLPDTPPGGVWGAVIPTVPLTPSPFPTSLFLFLSFPRAPGNLSCINKRFDKRIPQPETGIQGCRAPEAL
ncbi:hypothetical protein E2C01_043098 [Portunus trituberculatus]|uniref:Uncharacterized protein n=1 Tax=Portunus trituberculatus TaxID=210409 RepID=A0A5B7FNJ5_PORTR|nr:hypothetical protein [Portunus trituberculatus]